MRSLLPIVALVLGLGGCTQHDAPSQPETSAERWTAHRPIQPPAASPSSPADASPEDHTADVSRRQETPEGSPVESVNTGDCQTWPRYDFPLVIQIDPPPVPPEITEVSPAITAP
jgi:hypothetical protein